MSQYGTLLKRILIGSIAIAFVVASASAQDDTERAPKPHRVRHLVKAASATRRRIRAVLAPTDFPITLTAYDRTSTEPDASGTVLVVTKNGIGDTKSTALYTKDLEGAQISSVVSWQNTERTHFGFLVLTTPSEGNLYGVMFLLYHDGKLTMPIDSIATGYPVFPTIRRTDKTGQIQISFDEGSETATNDKLTTVDIYTWSDWSHRFVKTVHQVAAESVERTPEAAPPTEVEGESVERPLPKKSRHAKPKHKLAGKAARTKPRRVEKTRAAGGDEE